ncbi:antigenic thaumatin domain-containing protein [Apiospora sp. TS-2023a]
MQPTIGTLALITSLLASRNSVVLAGATRVENHCGFTIWCASAKTDGTASATRALGGGASATFQDIYDDNVGVSLKCADNAGFSHPFQMEGGINGGTAWYDLSALDGDPFLAQRRVGYWPNTNCQIVCNPGETSSCEWPVMPTCPNPTDMVLALC